MVTFKNDIIPIFEDFVSCMSQVQVASELGVEPARLDNYDFVKRFHGRILARLKGENEFGQPVPIMPPSGRLPLAQIELFEQWIEEGMLEDIVS